MTFQAYHRARRMGLALREVRTRRARGRCAQRQRLRIRERFSRSFHENFWRTAHSGEEARLSLRGTNRHAAWARCWPWRTMKDCVCSSLAIAARSNASLPILRQRLGKSVVPGEHRHLDATRRTVGRLFRRARISNSTSRWPRSDRNFNSATGKSCVPFRLAKRAPIPGWRNGMGDPAARRAVGRANGTNMICIVIPCHRVIRADGTLCGYGGGLGARSGCTTEVARIVANDDAIDKSRISAASAPRRTRTSDRRIRNPMLYPAELWAPSHESNRTLRHCNHLPADLRRINRSPLHGEHCVPGWSLTFWIWAACALRAALSRATVASCR